MATPKRSVQFNSIEDVVGAYEANGMPALAIWQDKQLMFPYEAEDIEDGVCFLNGLLSKLQNSAATYTLSVYRKVGEDGILSTTPFACSFNFRLKELRDEDGQYLTKIGNASGHNNEILTQLAAMRLELNDLRSQVLEEVEEVSETGLGAVIGKLINSPKFDMVITGLINKFIGDTGVVQKNIGMGTIPVDDDKLKNVIDRLMKCDPKIVEHLEKLALIAESDPAGFKSLLVYLEGI